MKTLKGIVAVIFRENDGTLEFLIFHRILNWSGWELLKGSIDEGEKTEDALKREIFEEAGLKKIEIVKRLPLTLRFFDKIRKCKREMQSFLVKAHAAEKVSFENNDAAEHDAFEWALAETAIKKLTHKEQKNILKTALKQLE